MKKLFTLVAVALMAIGANAQETYILDINQIYQDASTATGSCPNATQSDDTKYLLNDATITQDVFTVVSKSNRTFRTDLVGDEDINYGDYIAHARLEPNGASNSTGGRQIFLETQKSGTLYIGAWTGTTGRGLYVLPAEDTSSFVDTEGTQETALLYQALDEEAETGAVYTVKLQPGIYCITQDAGIYYAYIKFVEDTGAGITNVTTEENADPNAPVYNLAGQRVNKDTKGILIQNGKKFINK